MRESTRIESGSREDTYELGKRIGEQAKPGMVYTLVGDLGVGKTVLTQGVAAGIGEAPATGGDG